MLHSKYSIILQIFLIIIVFSFIYLFDVCIIYCKSFLYGVFIALLHFLLVTIVNNIALIIADKSPKKGIAFAFLFAGIRFVVVGLLFALGLGFFMLLPVPMLLAFVILYIVGQLLGLFKFSKN